MNITSNLFKRTTIRRFSGSTRSIMGQKVKAAVGQICSGISMNANLEQCVDLTSRAARAGATILFLPEAADYIATSPSQSQSLAHPKDKSPFVLGLQSAARRHKIAIHVGIHDPAPPDTNATHQPSITKKLYNTTIYITPEGKINDKGTYNKLHLFDYAALRESASTQAGSGFTPPFSSPIGMIGSLICFDLRFPEAALHLTQPQNHPSIHPTQTQEAESSTTNTNNPTYNKPAQVLLYPSAFTIPTGLAHWSILLRARAIETQSYVIASAQVGRHNPFDPSKPGGGRVSYGHSMVVSPWGEVLLELKGVADENARVREVRRESGAGLGMEGVEEERWEAEDGAVGELGVFEVDLDEVGRVREKMPLMRRTDVYPAF